MDSLGFVPIDLSGPPTKEVPLTQTDKSPSLNTKFFKFEAIRKIKDQISLSKALPTTLKNMSSRISEAWKKIIPSSWEKKLESMDSILNLKDKNRNFTRTDRFIKEYIENNKSWASHFEKYLQGEDPVKGKDPVKAQIPPFLNHIKGALTDLSDKIGELEMKRTNPKEIKEAKEILNDMKKMLPELEKAEEIKEQMLRGAALLKPQDVPPEKIRLDRIIKTLEDLQTTKSKESSKHPVLCSTITLLEKALAKEAQKIVSDSLQGKSESELIDTRSKLLQLKNNSSSEVKPELDHALKVIDIGITMIRHPSKEILKKIAAEDKLLRASIKNYANTAKAWARTFISLVGSKIGVTKDMEEKNIGSVKELRKYSSEVISYLGNINKLISQIKSKDHLSKILSEEYKEIDDLLNDDFHVIDNVRKFYQENQDIKYSEQKLEDKLEKTKNILENLENLKKIKYGLASHPSLRTVTPLQKSIASEIPKLASEILANLKAEEKLSEASLVNLRRDVHSSMTRFSHLNLKPLFNEALLEIDKELSSLRKAANASQPSEEKGKVAPSLTLSLDEIITRGPDSTPDLQSSISIPSDLERIAKQDLLENLLKREALLRRVSQAKNIKDLKSLEAEIRTITSLETLNELVKQIQTLSSPNIPAQDIARLIQTAHARSIQLEYEQKNKP